MNYLKTAVWATLGAAVVCCPFGERGMSAEAGVVALAPDPSGRFTDVTIAGRRIRVSASLALTTPSPIPEGPPASLVASIGISTADSRGLPEGMALRGFRAVNGRRAWSDGLVFIQTFQYDPQSSFGTAWGGPLWEEGSRTTVVVEMTRLRRTYRVTVRPVVVGRLP